MNTPVYDFLNKYGEDNKIRFHMPGHKGKELTGNGLNDLTEVDGADVLYSAEGIIKESMENAASLFGTHKTLYSTEGSSLAIRAMVYLIKLYAVSKGKEPLIFAFRNAHKTFVTATAVMGVNVKWLYGEKNKGITCCNITAEEVRNQLEKSETLPTALYVTSPDYTGNIADIKALSEMCDEKDILLIVDNAHGAYLNFLEENTHPIYLGAHMCCDSAHKTLPVLTGGAYLHISEKAPDIFKGKAEYAMSLFASTSPSYLIMSSLDKANNYLEQSFRGELKLCCEKVKEIREKLTEHGYSFVGDEPMKITFDCKKYGYSGYEIGDYLSHKGIVCEFCDPDYLVLMPSPFNSDDEFEKLTQALLSLPKKETVEQKPPAFAQPDKVLSFTDTLYLSTEKVPLEKAYGRVCGEVSVSCPPAVPIVIAGERIGEREKDLLEYYGVKEITVICEK